MLNLKIRKSRFLVIRIMIYMPQQSTNYVLKSLLVCCKNVIICAQSYILKNVAICILKKKKNIKSAFLNKIDKKKNYMFSLRVPTTLLVPSFYSYSVIKRIKHL